MVKEGNSNAQTHGGEAAVKSIQKGEPLRGIARDAELAVRDEYEDEGRPSIVIRNATRVQAAADLYWNAISKAAQDKDIEALDKYVARFGWLSGKAMTAWDQVRKEEQVNEGVTAIEILEATRKDT